MMGYRPALSYAPQAIDVLKSSDVSDGQGGWQKTWAVDATVRGHLVPETGRIQRERQISDTQTAMISHKAYLPAGTSVDNDDRVRLAGKDYRVVSAMTAASLSSLVVCDLLEVS